MRRGVTFIIGVVAGVLLRTFWLSTAASYQVKLSSGFDAKRPSVRSASARC
jgi:hypothetical protein